MVDQIFRIFEESPPKTKLFKTKENDLGFAFGGRQGRVSATSTALPIWATDSFKPVRVSLIEGKTELLSRLDIVRKLDIRAEFGRKRFRAGQGELEMMTFNEKHHWVFPLVPTACSYAKLGGYLGKLQKSQMEGLQVQGFFGSFGSPESGQSQNRRLGVKMETQKRLFRT